MTPGAPHKVWWTAGELAEAGWPDVPATRQGVDALAERNAWRAQGEFARRRKGRGGGCARSPVARCSSTSW